MSTVALFLVLVLATLVSAFPRDAYGKLLKSFAKRGVANAIPLPSTGVPLGVTNGCKRIPDLFHPYQAPGPNDVRGVCPGLNIMANYGYIPRNGIASLTQLVYGQMEMLGFCYDLAEFLAVLGVSVCGDPTSQLMSIGGQDVRTNSLLTSYTPARGNNVHNGIECDGSLARDDAYFHNGNTDVFNSSRWAEFVRIANEASPAGLWDLNAMTLMRDWQYKYCIANNPECLWGNAAVAFNAGQSLVWLSMPSADPTQPSCPKLPPTYAAISKFFGITRQGTGYHYTVGSEKLPPSPDGFWYRQAQCTSLIDIGTIATHVFLTPEPHPVGGNTGTVNSFTPGTSQPAQPVSVSNYMCFLLRAADSLIPSVLDSAAANVLADLTSWANSAIGPLFTPWNC